MTLKVIYDSAQKAGKHEKKHQWLIEHGIDLANLPLPVADYILETDRVRDVVARKMKRGVQIKKIDLLGTYSVAVDTKFSITELCQDIRKDHDRFRDELILAKNNGIKLYILIENDDGIQNVMELSDLEQKKKTVVTKSGDFRTKLKYPHLGSGKQLAKAICTMQEKYGAEFRFCHPDLTGSEIVKLLTSE